MGEKSTQLVQGSKKGIRGNSRRSKQHSAKLSAIRTEPKVRTAKVQAKKDRNVFRHSNGIYKTVVEMQVAGQAGASKKSER